MYWTLEEFFVLRCGKRVSWLRRTSDQVVFSAASHAIAAIQAFITGAASNCNMSTNIA